jgi:hypothetical protein
MSILNHLSTGSIISGIGLIGLALYDISQGQYGQAVNEFLAALTAFGLSVNLASHQALKEQLNRKGMI